MSLSDCEKCWNTPCTCGHQGYLLMPLPEGLSDRQKALAKKHGTPEQFGKAVWHACDMLVITTAEAATAIDKYKREWDQACATPGTPS